jgi:hypothetical protein
MAHALFGRVNKNILKVRNNIVDAVMCNIIMTQHCIKKMNPAIFIRK